MSQSIFIDLLDSQNKWGHLTMPISFRINMQQVVRC